MSVREQLEHVEALKRIRKTRDYEPAELVGTLIHDERLAYFDEQTWANRGWWFDLHRRGNGVA